MWIFLVFVMPEFVEPLFEVGTHGRGVVIFEAPLVIAILVFSTIGEVCDFAWTLYGRRGALEPTERLYWVSVCFD